VFCCLATTLSDLNFALIAPFFPIVALAHGLTSTGIGVIFAAQPLSVMIGALCAPLVLERVGAFVTLRSSILAQALFTLAMASVDRLAAGWLPFLIACTALRVLQGLACGFTETAAASLAMRSVSTQHIATAVGVVSASRGLGVVSGPPLGGVTFDSLGFAAPFALAALLMFILGCTMLVVVPLATHAPAPNATSNPPTWDLLRVSAVLVALVAMWSVHSSITFLAPTLQPFLTAPPFSLSPSAIGLVFMFCTIAFALMAALAGVISSIIGHAYQMMLGLLLIAVGYVFVGPAPWVIPFVGTSMGVTVTALVLAAMGGGLAMVPATPLMISGSQAEGFSARQSMDGVAALATLAGSFGGVSGPLFGGCFAEVFDFPTAASLFAIIPLLVAPLLFPFRKGARRQTPVLC